MLRTASSLICVCFLVLYGAFPSSGQYPRLATPNSTVIRMAAARTVSIHCNLDDSSVSDVDFVWYKQNAPISTTSSRVSPSSTSTTTALRVSNLEKSDSGWYTCRATNDDGFDYVDFVLVVGTPPTVTSQPNAQSTVGNVTIPIACFIDGMPSPSLTWHMGRSGDGPALPMCSGSPQQDACVNPNDFQLEVRVSGSTENDRYTCKGQNEFGSVTTNDVRLTRIQSSGNDVPSSRMSPYIATTQSEAVNLTCSDKDSGGAFTFFWYFNGDHVSSLMGRRMVSVTGQRGVHCCQIKRSSDLIATYCTYVLVRTHPNVTSSASQLITVDAGRRVGVVCAGSGTNDPQVQFLRDSTVLQSTTKYEVTSNSENHRLAYFLLHNTSLSDSGVYSCQALNFLSTTPSYFNISVVDPYVTSSNYLSNPGLEEGSNNWRAVLSGSGEIASRRIDNERVMLLSYSNRDASTSVSVQQSFTIPANVTSVRISARMRRDPAKSGSCIPVLELSVGSTISTCTWAADLSLTWAWTSCDITLTSQSGDNSSYQAAMTLRLDTTSSSSSSAGVLFDDVSVLPLSFAGTTTGPPMPEADLVPIIAGAAAGGAAVLVCLVVVIIACCFLCCCRKTKSDAVSMRKASMKRFSRFVKRHGRSSRATQNSISERQYASLHGQNPPSVYAGLNREGELYATVSNETTEQQYESIDPDKKEDYYYIVKPESIPTPKNRTPSQSNLLIPGQEPKISVTSLQSVTSSNLPPSSPQEENTTDDAYLSIVPNMPSKEEDLYIVDGPEDGQTRPKLTHQVTSIDSYVSMINPNQ